MKIFKNFVLGLVILIFSGCLAAGQNKQFITVKPKLVQEKVLFTANGFLELKEFWPLYAWAAGQVSQILARPEEKVQKGQIILKIANPDLEKSCWEIQKEVAHLEKEVQIDESLFQKGFLEESESSAARQKLVDLKFSAAEIFQKIKIRSGRSGRLVWLGVKQFDWVNPGDLLGYVFPLGLPRPEYFQVKTIIPENYLKNIKKNQEVVVKSENWPKLPARVETVAPFCLEEQKSSGVTVICRLINPAPKYFLKMPVAVEFMEKDGPALAIPRMALFKKSGRYFLFVLKKGEPQKKEVFNVLEGDEFVYLPLTSGLTEEKIILNIDEHQYVFED